MRNTDTCPGKILFAVFALLAALSPDGLLAGVGEWTSSGPEGAVVVALAAHPSNTSTVYLSTIRRVYKSVDGGALWSPTGLSGSFDLLLPTSAPSVAYAIMTNPFGFGATFYRTSDGGESWVGRATPPGRLVSMAVDPNDPMALYAVTSSGLFRTTNGGDVWEPLATPSAGGFGLAGIAVDPADSRVLYAALTAGNVPGVHRSSDRGATWNRTSLRDPTRQLLFDPTDDTRLFALTNAGLQVTTNRGESWRRLAPGQQVPSHLAIDPTDSNRLYIISGGVFFHSSDGGETMTPVSDGNFGENIRALAASESSVVLVGSERGIFRSDDAGRLWGAANLGIREVFVQSVAIDPTDPAVVFAAGSGGIYESRDGGETWNEPVPQSPDAEVVAIDPSEHSTLYAGGEGGVQKSTDGGHTWQKTGLVDYVAELVIDPSNARRLFAAYASVYRSLNGTESWNRVMTPDDDYSSYYYPPTVGTIAIAPSDGATVYAAGADGGGFIYRSDDGGDNWSDLTSVDFGVNALVVDSCDPRIVQAGGWGAVFRTLDGGNTWSGSPISQGRPYPDAVWALARDPRHSSTIFAGTSAGLLWTNDRGATWKRFEPALDEPVRSLAIDPSGRFLYAGTERGVFRLERSFESCRDGPDRLCLIGAKYRVSVTARDRTGTPITGRAIEEGDSFGYFSFPDVTGDPSFPEVFVKMVNASGLPPPYGGHDWVFHSSLTDLDYTLTVLETETGRVRTYEAADSESLTCGSADTSAFARECTAAAESSAANIPPAGIEAASGAELSLLSGRFRATIRATDPRTGRTADGTALAKGDRFGYFSLPSFTGDPSFPEVFVKMADATAQPGGYFWVFHTGLTDLDYTLTVTDQDTGAVRTYVGGATDGTRLCGSADTMAFLD